MTEHQADNLPTVTQSRSLSESESHAILADYGIPVARSVLAASREEAVDAARDIGYPIVLKGSSADLAHKSDAGVVYLDLNTDHEVSDAFDAIENAAVELDGALVQRQVQGARELVAGMVRDPQFGPCVMFGLGGIFTEVLDDAAFRIAPLAERDAYAMMNELRGAAILGEVRGMIAADEAALAAVLIAIGQLGIDRPDIEAIDVNPLIVQDDGALIAVDAAIWLSDTQ